jgi:hypothetical protein
MIEREYFTQVEAESKVGRRIRTLVAWSGVPVNATGRVIAADPAGRVKPPFEEAQETFNVAIEWDLPQEKPVAELVIPAAAGPYIFISAGKPLVDWFSKDEYKRYLEESGKE